MNTFVNFIVGIPLLGTVLPLLTAFFVKESTKSGWKGATTAFFAAVLGFASQAYEHIVNHSAYDWRLGVATGVVGYVVGQAVHYGIWKPTGLSKVLQKIGLPKKAAQEVSAKAEISLDQLKAKLDTESATLAVDPAAVAKAVSQSIAAPTPAAVKDAIAPAPVGKLVSVEDFPVDPPADGPDTSVEKL